MAKIKKKVSAQPKPPCEQCFQGSKLPDAIRFAWRVDKKLGATCEYCKGVIPQDTLRRLDNIAIRSAVMAERANAE